MTDYTDLKRRLAEAKMEAPVQGTHIGLDGKLYKVSIMEHVPLAREAAAAIAALEAEVARLRGELHQLPDVVHAIPTQYEDFDGTMRDTTAEWVHGRAYNILYERARATLTPR